MAAVQELFKRLMARRSLHKKGNKVSKENGQSGDASQLGGRSGVALPPVPPPGFLNLPDISRDCAQSPRQVYDEIPAYAIDTRLDILRDAYLERRRANSAQHPGAGLPPLEPYRGSGRSDPDGRHDRGERRQGVSGRTAGLPSGGGVGYGEVSTGQCVSSAPAPRQGTPWNDEYTSDGSDQLDQWVSIPESLNNLHVDGTHGQTPDSDRGHPWYEDDGRTEDSQWGHRGQSQAYGKDSSLDNVLRKTRRQNAMDSALNRRDAAPANRADAKQYPSPPPGALSDDSGVSSPSSREGGDTPWGSRCAPRHLLRHYRQYSDSDSSTYYRNPERASNRWCEQTAGGQLAEALNLDCSWSGGCGDSSRGRLDASSSDTYNEYDQHNVSFSDFDSLARSGHVNESMSPQEYAFYLGKIRNNLKKTHSIKTGARPASGCAPADGTATRNDWSARGRASGVDVASAETSPSEISTLSEQEIHKLLQDHQPGRSRNCASPRDRTRHGNDTCTQRTGLASPPDNKRQESAFRPYSSRRSQGAPVIPPNADKARTIGAMSLADKLSCRATRPGKGVSSQLRANKARVLGRQAASTTQNLLLSDIMKRNHDRQILVVI